MSGDQLTLLPAESLASLSVWPGSRQAQQMTVTSGRNLLASSRLCGPVGSALKTLVGSSAWRSTMCLLTWKPKVTPAGRLYYQLQVSVPRIEEIGSGLWPTPTVGVVTGGQNPDKGGQAGIRYAVLKSLGMWPTPRARDSHEEGLAAGIRHKEKWGSQTLATAAKTSTGMFPTPRAIYGEHPGMTDPRHLTGAAMLPTPTVQDGKNNGAPSQHERNSLPLNAVVNGKLNPAWVSRMQGFPDGWMELE